MSERGRAVRASMRTQSRLLQTCGSLKMMAMVRTSLQKVVVFLHRLQRMAISSPRYQKLCKVRGGMETDRVVVVVFFLFKTLFPRFMLKVFFNSSS